MTPDSQVWRLDWFGNCAYPSRFQRYAQPSVKVVLSRLRCDPSDTATLLHHDSTEHQHPHEAWVPIAALPLLAIGDLWHLGRRIASPDYQQEIFRKLHVVAETTSFVKAGLAIDEHFLLPLHRHPWHRLHTQSYCIAVALDHGRRLLIPCMEIIRFYFGSSSNFIQRLFTAPLSHERLWVEKQLNPTTHHLHMVLAGRLSGMSATDIGRIAEDRFAWRSAAGIYASCQKAAAQQHPIYPYTGFPFEGFTDLVADGIWLPFGDQEQATYLTYRLRSCSHPFPFRSLSYEAADRKAYHSSPEKAQAQRGSISQLQSKPAAADPRDASAGRPQRSARFVSRNRFPDLVRKPVWRERIEAMGGTDIFLRREDGSLEQVAFGESDRCTPITGIDASADQRDKVAPLPKFVHIGLNAIKMNPNYMRWDGGMELVILPGKAGPAFAMPLLIDEYGEVDERLHFTLPSGKVRQRRVCFVEVLEQVAKPHSLLLIVEGQTLAARPEILVAGSFDITAALQLLAPNLH